MKKHLVILFVILGYIHAVELNSCKPMKNMENVQWHAQIFGIDGPIGSGALISPHLIVTTASSMPKDTKLSDISVKFLSVAHEIGSAIKIKKITKHPNYSEVADNKARGTRRDDIALISIEYRDEYTKYLSPICVGNYSPKEFKNTKAIMHDEYGTFHYIDAANITASSSGSPNATELYAEYKKVAKDVSTILIWQQIKPDVGDLLISQSISNNNWYVVGVNQLTVGDYSEANREYAILYKMHYLNLAYYNNFLKQ